MNDKEQDLQMSCSNKAIGTITLLEETKNSAAGISSGCACIGTTALVGLGLANVSLVHTLSGL